MRAARLATATTSELTIQQASQLLNVPAPTIRSWERRYGVPLAGRSTGGHRRYGRVQLDQLRRMRDLIARGRRTVEAAALVKAGHATSPGPLVEAFLQAARDLAPGSIARTLDAARETLGLDRHRRRGAAARHARGGGMVARRPDRRLPRAPRDQCDPSLVGRHPPDGSACDSRHRSSSAADRSTTTPSDWRRSARSSASAAGTAACWAPVPRLSRWPAPLPRLTRLRWFWSVTSSAGRPAAIEALRSPQLRQRQVFYAGGAFASPRARHGVPGQYLGTNIAQATDLITAMLTSASS